MCGAISLAMASGVSMYRATLSNVFHLPCAMIVSKGIPANAIACAPPISLDIAKGQTLGLVGESGSGKSSLARALLRLEETDSGTIRYNGHNITHLAGPDLQRLRKSIQVVLQDPYSALNPRKLVRASIAEGPIIHGMPKKKAYARAEELLELTGLSSTAGQRYPHEFSGGQRQRICIARALALEPEPIK